MTDLIAFITKDQVVESYLKKLIEDEQWDNVFLFSPEKNQENKNFEVKNKKIEIIYYDSKKPVPELVSQMKEMVKEKIKGFEVGVNLIAGTGKEHMALISALISSGIAIRLVVLTPRGVIEI